MDAIVAITTSASYVFRRSASVGAAMFEYDGGCVCHGMHDSVSRTNLEKLEIRPAAPIAAISFVAVLWQGLPALLV